MTEIWRGALRGGGLLLEQREPQTCGLLSIRPKDGSGFLTMYQRENINSGACKWMFGVKISTA